MKRGFTMIELVFVIVILGILSAIAAPKLFATREDAVITRARADISSIRSAVVNARNTNMLRGNFAYPALEGADNTLLFEGVLSQGITPNAREGWTLNNGAYTFNLGGTATVFQYNQNNGTFDCVVAANNKCQQLTK